MVPIRKETTMSKSHEKVLRETTSKDGVTVRLVHYIHHHSAGYRDQMCFEVVTRNGKAHPVHTIKLEDFQELFPELTGKLFPKPVPAS